MTIRPSQIILALIGIALTVFALRIPERWIDFAPGSANQLLLLAFGVLVVSLALLGNRFPIKGLQNAYQTGAVILLNTVLFLLIVEMIATLSVNLKYQFVFGGQVVAEDWDIRPDFPYFKQVEWGGTYWREHNQRKTIYEPYVMWRLDKFTGETINVDAEGIRFTPGATCSEDAYSVFMFGGSTMWGEGAPDWATIPAYVQQGLSAVTGQPICVVNYGELAYVSDQEILKLTLLLQAGERPDLVIFYDGFNDVFASYQNGEAGVHQNLASIQGNIESGNLGTLLARAIVTSNTYKLARGALLGQQITTEYGTNTDLEALAVETTQAYLENYDFVANLAQIYEFEYAFFWQPSLLFAGKSLTQLEAGILSSQDANWIALNTLVYDQVKAVTDRDQLYYIADILDDVTDFLYFDYAHIVPEGNAMVANQMLEVITLTLER